MSPPVFLELEASAESTTTATFTTTATVTATADDKPQPQPQPVYPPPRKESSMDLFMQYLPFIILFLVLAIIIFLCYIFRDKLPICIHCLEVRPSFTKFYLDIPYSLLLKRGFCVFHFVVDSSVLIMMSRLAVSL